MRPVANRILVVLIIFTLVMGTACSFPQALISNMKQDEVAVEQPAVEQPGDPSPTQPDEAPDAAGSGEIASAEGEVEVRVQEEGFEPSRYPSRPLGSISFTVDESAVKEREITPSDETAGLQVVDSAGLTWSLEIPGGALESTQTVKMVALSQLDSSAVAETVGELVSGVRLEPDGLTFLKPARLSVSGPALEGPTFILAGSHTGAEVDYTLQDTEAGQPAARILHFSTYFASQPDEKVLSDAQKQAGKEYQRLAAEAKKILKSALEFPTPPSIPLECPDSETGQKNGEALSKFVDNALNPENDLILQLLKQRTILALTGDGEAGGVGDVETALVGRIGRKATAMMDQFSNQEEKLVAVSEFAIQAARKVALLSGDQAVIEQILAKLASWNNKLIDKLIDDIKENHNYKKIPVVWMVAYRAELLGAKTDTDRFVEKLKNALRFEVQINFTVNMPDINNITEAVVPVQFEPENGVLYSCSGDGEGKHLKATVDDEEITVETTPYPVHVEIKEFDPCNGTVVIGVDRFGSDGDTMTVTTEDGSETHPWPISRNAGQSLFDKELSGGMFWFELEVENGSATAVDETIERSKFDSVNGELTIKLIHK